MEEFDTHLRVAEFVLSMEIESLKKIKDELSHEFEAIVEIILQCSTKVIVLGMGKSGIIGRKISATLSSTGTPSYFLHPAEAFHGDLGTIGKNDVVIAISNSGETEEVIRLIPFLRENGNVIISMSGDASSTLAKNSHYNLSIRVEREACPLQLAPTSSTTVTLALGDALAISLMSAKGFRAENFARFHPGGSLGRKLLTRVSDVMKTNDLPTNKITDDFALVVNNVSRCRLGATVILLNDKVVGIVTDGDISRALNKKINVYEYTAKDIMTPSPFMINEDDMFSDAERIMEQQKITVLPVCNEKCSLVGMVHKYDLIC